MFSDEQWLDIEDFPGYQVSSFGSVKSFKQRQPKLHALSKGNHYLQCSLSNDGVIVTKHVHQLVAAAFHGHQPNLVVRHLDGDCLNNSATNLRYGTHKENMDDQARHGTLAFGERCGSSKLTDTKVRLIRKLRKHGISAKDLIKAFGVAKCTIYRVLSGKTWKHIPN